MPDVRKAATVALRKSWAWRGADFISMIEGLQFTAFTEKLLEIHKITLDNIGQNNNEFLFVEKICFKNFQEYRNGSRLVKFGLVGPKSR